MSSFNLHRNGLTMYTRRGVDECNNQLQPPLNVTISGIDMSHYYAHLQNNIGGTPSLGPVPSLEPPYVAPVPSLALYPPRPNIVPQPVLYSHNAVNIHNQAFISTVPTHHQSTAPTSTFLQLTSTATPTTVFSPIAPVVQRISTSQRAKFPCPSCGKVLTSRPRAWTCFFKHVGTKPYACNGTCGVQGW
jgi:predicted RNA-binding Zn-ribbon protein involved in translation (DUF1610 family)